MAKIFYVQIGITFSFLTFVANFITMGIIRLNNITIYAYHGCLEEEGKIGSEYRVDVEVKANLNKSAKTDKLTDTVDYVHLNNIIREEMAIRSKLLEHVTQRILDRFFKEIPMLKKAKVSVSKINPPMRGNVKEVSVIMNYDFDVS